MKTIFSKVSVLQNRLRYGCLSISFPNTFLWLLPNIEHKRIPVNDNIVWCKYSRGIKNLSKSGSCFLLNYPKYLGATLFHSLYAQTLRIFWNVFLEKKSVKFKRFFVKINPLRVSKLKCLVFKFLAWQNFKVS